MSRPITTIDDLVLALRVRFTDTEDVRTTKKAIVEIDDGTGQLDLPLARGPQGFPGMSIVSAAVINGFLILTRDDGTQFNAGPANQAGPRGLQGIEGPEGPAGPPGVVSRAQYDELLRRVAALEAGGGTSPTPEPDTSGYAADYSAPYS